MEHPSSSSTGDGAATFSIHGATFRGTLPRVMALNQRLMPATGPMIRPRIAPPLVLQAPLMPTQGAAPEVPPQVGPQQPFVQPGGTRPVPFPAGMQPGQPRPMHGQPQRPVRMPQMAGGQDALLQAMMGGYRRTA